VRITTGSLELDASIGGGIRTGSITGVFGESGAGKSNLCMTLAVRCQLLVSQGGAEGKCVYIDTKGGFQPERVAEIAAANNLPVEDIKRNIIYTRVMSSNQLFQALVKTKVFMAEHRTALLVIDSATYPFRVEYVGRGELQPRQAKINALFRVLRECVSQSNIAVVVTAEAYSSPDPFHPNKLIVGGNVIQYGCHSM